MSMVLPEAVPVEGTRRVIWIPGGPANIDAITLTEINAGENISCYLTGDGWNATGEQAVISDPRLCSSEDNELPGRKSKTLSLRYVYNLNSPTDDEARLALVEGSDGVLVNVLQKPEEDDVFEVGDWYEAWPVRAGEPMVLPSEANAVDRIEQRMFKRGRVAKFKQLVAGA